MNLQRREEIRELIAEIARYEELGATLDLESKARDAITELLAHIDTLEQTAAERVIADGSRGPTPDYTGEGSAWVPPVEAQAVVVSELTDEDYFRLVQSITCPRGTESVGQLLTEFIREHSRAIPAGRELGEGVVALRRFAERCAQRDHQPDEHIGCAKCVACEAEDALRANQGGSAT